MNTNGGLILAIKYRNLAPKPIVSVLGELQGDLHLSTDDSGAPGVNRIGYLPKLARGLLSPVGISMTSSLGLG